MKLRLLTYVAAAMMFGSFSGSASPLSDLTEAAKMTWLIGAWATEGGDVKVAYTWKLDKYVIGVTFHSPERDAEGMIALKPGTETATYVGADNKGGVVLGEWFEYNDHATLRSVRKTANGDDQAMAVEHIQVDADTLHIKVYKLNANKEPGEMVAETDLKRVK